jgi:prefoldin subunit 5
MVEESKKIVMAQLEKEKKILRKEITQVQAELNALENKIKKFCQLMERSAA